MIESVIHFRGRNSWYYMGAYYRWWWL